MRKASHLDIPLFATLTETERKQLGDLGARRLFGEGDTVFRAGDLRNALMVVLKGRLRIFQMFNGHPETLALLEAGSFSGEEALVNPTKQHQHSAVADIASELLFIPGDAFLALERKQPHLAVKLLSSVLSVIADRLTHADTKLLTLYATGRIAALATDLRELIHLILSTVARTVHARQALFVLFHPEEQRAMIRDAIGYRKNLQGRSVALDRDPVLGRVFRSDEAVVVTRTQTSRDAHWETVYSSSGMLAVPITVGRSVLGAIYVGDKRNGEDFSVNNRLLLSIVTNQIAVSVQDAKLEEEKRASEELERVYIQPL
ncbi:MAG: cyclic nucleotide-binding domain-containing protein [Candidatus Kerfeldbacteria bacterium]|nr:cyclic nucleotide-binding domain-containing protein [Candidatus Kerfeldbacteria bacterium]